MDVDNYIQKPNFPLFSFVKNLVIENMFFNCSLNDPSLFEVAVQPKLHVFLKLDLQNGKKVE